MATIAPPKSKGAATGVSGEFTKLSLVGKGSFGSVWLVRHTQKGGETRIMKEVQIMGLSQAELRATKQETAVLKHVNHPNIIGYIGTFENDGNVCIVMEYAAGGDLGRLIKKRIKENARFTETDIKRYAMQLGSALEYLHNDIKLLHRDVKPNNVFLSAEGDVRLGDFGLSKVLSKTDDVAEAQVGTPLYMSPELANGKPYDRGADVWAFGCTLFEAMSFKPPWSEMCTPDGGLEGGMKALANALRNRSLDIMQLRSHYSADWCDKLTKLLAKRREDRMPLSTLIAQLTEAPKHPASWGLSAAAQAALEEANIPAPPLAAPAPRKSNAGKNSLDEFSKEVEEGIGPLGIEEHAAAGVLQRSWAARKQKEQAKSMQTAPKKIVNMVAPDEQTILTWSAPSADETSKAPNIKSKHNLGDRLKIPVAPAIDPNKKSALKPSRVGMLKPALKADVVSFAGPLGGTAMPSASEVRQAARPPSSIRAPKATPRSSATAPKSVPAAGKKPGLKPTRVRDGLG